MKVINCVRCKKAFVRVNGLVCPECVEFEEEQFEVIKEFLYQNPKSTMEEISEGTEVPVKRIIQFLKEGRLEGIEGSTLKCSRCGIEITKGKYCIKCSKHMKNGLKAIQEGEDIDSVFQEKARVSLMKTKDRHNK